MHLMEVTVQVAVQVEAVSMARAPVQVEEDFTVRAIWVTREVIIHNLAKVTRAVFMVRARRVTREVIIHNPAKVISSNSPDIRVTQNS